MENMKLLFRSHFGISPLHPIEKLFDNLMAWKLA